MRTVSVVPTLNASAQVLTIDPVKGLRGRRRPPVAAPVVLRTVRPVTTPKAADRSLTVDPVKGARGRRRPPIDSPAVVRTVRPVTTTKAAAQSLTTTPVKGSRPQANRHLDKLFSPGKDPADLSGRAWLGPVEVPAKVRAQVAELVEAYRRHQLTRPDVAKRVRQESAFAEGVKIGQFLLYAAVREPGRAPASYDVELIERYRGELAEVGAKPNTANAALSALRKFFDFILDPGEPNPARAVLWAKTSAKGGKRATYTRGQVDAILAVAAVGTTGVRPRAGHPRKTYLAAWTDYVAVAVWTYTGAESGMLLRARLGDVDLPGAAITWRDSDGRPTYTQPLPDQLVSILAEYLAVARRGASLHEALVTNPRAKDRAGGPMTDQALLQLARRVAGAAGAGTGDGHGQGHTLRRWRNTYIARVSRAQHGSPLTIKVLLGLREFASADRYESLAVATKTVSINDAHTAHTAPAGLDTHHWPTTQLRLVGATTGARPAKATARATAAAATTGAGSGPRRRARVQVRDLTSSAINPCDPSTLLGCERSFPGHLGGQGNSEETQAAYLLEAVYLRAWLAGHAPGLAHPRHATGDLLLAYLDHLADAGSSVATRRRTTTALRAYFGYLSIKHPGMVNPADVLPSLAEVVTEADTHTEDDVAAVLACVWEVATDAFQRGDKPAWALARRDHAILASLAFGAARRTEARGVATLDVDADINMLILHGKGQASRTIIIPDVLAQILAAYTRDVRQHFPAGDYLFSDPASAGGVTDEYGDDGPALGKEVIYRIAYHYGTLAGVEGPVNPHSYRHSAASRMHAAGMSIGDIGAYLGHHNPMITLRYIHITQPFLRTVLAEAFPPAAASVPLLPQVPACTGRAAGLAGAPPAAAAS